VSGPDSKPAWARLFRVACALIRQVNAEQSVIDHWTFGGGTAMMLQIDHRESRDVDIFLLDPQFLPLLDTQKHDFVFEIDPIACTGDGARFLRLAFENIGEIDFIVGGSLTSMPSRSTAIEGENVQLETIPEVIAKKIYHRGSNIKPRDIFDIAAAGLEHANSIIDELRRYKNQVGITLSTMERLNPAFVNSAIAELAIKPRYAPVGETALDRAREILRAV